VVGSFLVRTTALTSLFDQPNIALLEDHDCFDQILVGA
jgi:hypothetical protein